MSLYTTAKHGSVLLDRLFNRTWITQCGYHFQVAYVRFACKHMSNILNLMPLPTVHSLCRKSCWIVSMSVTHKWSERLRPSRRNARIALEKLVLQISEPSKTGWLRESLVFWRTPCVPFSFTSKFYRFSLPVTFSCWLLLATLFYQQLFSRFYWRKFFEYNACSQRENRHQTPH